MKQDRKSKLAESRSMVSPLFDGDDGLSDAPRVGADLRAARHRLGWELPEVAAGLRIRLPYLEALEDGRIVDLPGNAYALGFLRTYATALGLDPLRTVAAVQGRGRAGHPEDQTGLPRPGTGARRAGRCDRAAGCGAGGRRLYRLVQIVGRGSVASRGGDTGAGPACAAGRAGGAPGADARGTTDGHRNRRPLGRIASDGQRNATGVAEFRLRRACRLPIPDQSSPRHPSYRPARPPAPRLRRRRMGRASCYVPRATPGFRCATGADQFCSIACCTLAIPGRCRFGPICC